MGEFAAPLLSYQEISLPCETRAIAKQPVDLGLGNAGSLGLGERKDESRWGELAVIPKRSIEIHVLEDGHNCGDMVDKPSNMEPDLVARPQARGGLHPLMLRDRNTP